MCCSRDRSRLYGLSENLDVCASVRPSFVREILAPVLAGKTQILKGFSAKTAPFWGPMLPFLDHESEIEKILRNVTSGDLHIRTFGRPCTAGLI